MSWSRRDRRLSQAEGRTEGKHYVSPEARRSRAYYIEQGRKRRAWLSSLPEQQRLAEEERGRERERQHKEAMLARGGPGYPRGSGKRG